MQRKLSTKTPYINLSLRLKEFDLKCIPIWHKMDNETYEKQFKLGEAVFAALVEWDSAPVEQTHAVISKLKQDVRNQVNNMIEKQDHCSTAQIESNSENDDASINQIEPERRFIDGKWFCEDSNGGFLVFEEDKWIAATGNDLKEKWDRASTIGEISENPYRCVVDGVTMEWNQISQQWLPVVEVNEDFWLSITVIMVSHMILAKRKGWVELEEERNTSVYVSNLPFSITEESFIELMSKCGVIQRDARTNKLKVKLYKNEDGTIKGDGRCCYIKKESVIMALDILDGWNVDGKIISVEKAKIFEWKPEKPRNYRPISDCTIVMKNMFTLEQMMKNAALMLDLEEEIRKVCERFGTNNPEGVICVTFQNVEHSDIAVRSLNGRVVDGRQISVTLWDGKTKYTMYDLIEN
ncbi:hypothetical protein DINM_003769 [Dirofilaria immitis]|nr:hypothetical protein [Dirofilaria immitis]